MQSGLRSGKLTKWKDERGFGFIQPVDGSQEVFLHISEVKDATRRPQENGRCQIESSFPTCLTQFIMVVRETPVTLSMPRNPMPFTYIFRQVRLTSSL